MIDPFTAFAMAQGAVAGIKKAVALGKDIKGLMNEFSSFYQHADAVHVASTKMKIASIGKSDAQISSDALEIAMASKALREHEKELKDMLFWSGNASVWEEMMSERTRMTKERNAAEKAEADKKQKLKEDTLNTVWNILIAVAVLALLIPVAALTFQLSTRG